jgi:hypothetical protein
MGHKDAQQRKVELGLIRALDEYDIRKVKALRWMVRFGFSTSKILNRLFLSKNDLARMKKERLVEDFCIGFKVHKDSRPKPLFIYFPTRTGRRLGKVGDYIGKPYPSLPMISHDLIAQGFVADRLEHQFGGFEEFPEFDARPARMIAKTGYPGIDLNGYLPDVVFGVDGNLSVIEVERNPVLIKSGKSAALEKFKFYEKLNYLVDDKGLDVTLIYITQFMAQRSWEYCTAASAYGYDSFTKMQNGEYFADRDNYNGKWYPVKKPLLFPVDAVCFDSIERLGLSDWLP